MKVTDTRASSWAGDPPICSPWELSTGRKMGDDPGALFLSPGSTCSVSGVSTAGPDGPDYPSCTDYGRLTPAERLEIAAAVKACWDRWAETGEP